MKTSINNYPEKLKFEINHNHPYHTGVYTSPHLIIKSENEEDNTLNYTILGGEKLHEFICVLESFYKEIKHLEGVKK